MLDKAIWKEGYIYVRFFGALTRCLYIENILFRGFEKVCVQFIKFTNVKEILAFPWDLIVAHESIILFLNPMAMSNHF